MKTRIYLIAALVLLAGIAWGQASLGFTNANGFPATVVGSQNYSLSGWIKNTGSSAFGGALAITIQVDSATPFVLQNNFNVNPPLQPGDSIFWQRNNYNFPANTFRTGNNDVLIWPTSPAIQSDTLQYNIFYTLSSQLNTEYVRTHPQGTIRPGGRQGIVVGGLNAGDKPLEQAICLYVGADGIAPHCAGQYERLLEPGAAFEWMLREQSLSELLGLAEGDARLSTVTEVRFYLAPAAIEGEVAYTPLSLPVEREASQPDLESRTKVTVYPNPAHGSVHVELPSDWNNDGTVRLIDALGRVVLDRRASADGNLNIGAIPAGTYTLVVQGAKGVHRQALVVQ